MHSIIDFIVAFSQRKHGRRMQREGARIDEFNNVRLDFVKSQINNEKDTSGFIKFGPGGRMFFDELRSLETIRHIINTVKMFMKDWRLFVFTLC